MHITMMKSKIHRAYVTEANLNYVGSITIDKNLMAAANIFENEQVHVVNITNGERFITYAITGEEDSGVVCLNGACARLCQVSDRVIIMTYCVIDQSAVAKHRPIIVSVDSCNRNYVHMSESEKKPCFSDF